jgi:23S rRNA (cytidine1920-2'-O)/16S rRNA (cytidine1409-2'-O)-methyltransferase
MSNDLPNTVRRKATPKQRLDLLLVTRGLVEHGDMAPRLIMAGDVQVDGNVIDKPGAKVPITAKISVRAPRPYVSRGGLKLAAALDEFHLDVSHLVVVDVGAAAGGFTDCLLQRGAAHVYAVDVGYGQLAWKLRNDPRVTPLERTNVRFLDQLPGRVLADLAVIDASFIGLELTLPAALRLLRPTAQVVALVKPQFEAAQEDVGARGVVRDEKVHRRVLEDAVSLARSLTLAIAGVTVSPVLGPTGNVEFFLWLQRTLREDALELDATWAIDNALRTASTIVRHS